MSAPTSSRQRLSPSLVAGDWGMFSVLGHEGGCAEQADSGSPAGR